MVTWYKCKLDNINETSLEIKELNGNATRLLWGSTLIYNKIQLLIVFFDQFSSKEHWKSDNSCSKSTAICDKERSPDCK